jgi:orotate phosphoribosyltransferase
VVFPEKSRAALVAHLRAHSLRTDGPFTLRSGAVSDWYIDARQTTFDGRGAAITGQCVCDALPATVEAVGGMTMGADPIAVSAAVVAASSDRSLRAFSIRKEAKDHGVGGRLVGPVAAGDRVAVVEDTTSTGAALLEAIDVLEAAGVLVEVALSVVDRSAGRVAGLLAERGIPYIALTTPTDLGVGE